MTTDASSKKTETMATTTIWTREQIDGLLDKSRLAVERAIVVLFERQTSDEQAHGATKHSNNRGFSQAYAHYGTYCARWVLSGKSLSGKHLDKCRHIAKKHSKQLVEEANKVGSN